MRGGQRVLWLLLEVGLVEARTTGEEGSRRCFERVRCMAGFVWSDARRERRRRKRWWRVASGTWKQRVVAGFRGRCLKREEAWRAHQSASETKIIEAERKEEKEGDEQVELDHLLLPLPCVVLARR